MADIKVSSEQLESMAGEIRAIANDLDGIIGEAGGLVSQISSVWEGLAHESFMSDYNSQKENLAQLGEIVFFRPDGTRFCALSSHSMPKQKYAIGSSAAQSR